MMVSLRDEFHFMPQAYHHYSLFIIHPSSFINHLILSSADTDDIRDGHEFITDGFQFGHVLDLKTGGEDAAACALHILAVEFLDPDAAGGKDHGHVHIQAVAGDEFQLQDGVEGLVVLLCPMAADPAGGRERDDPGWQHWGSRSDGR